MLTLLIVGDVYSTVTSYSRWSDLSYVSIHRQVFQRSFVDMVPFIRGFEATRFGKLDPVEWKAQVVNTIATASETHPQPEQGVRDADSAILLDICMLAKFSIHQRVHSYGDMHVVAALSHREPAKRGGEQGCCSNEPLFAAMIGVHDPMARFQHMHSPLSCQQWSGRSTTLMQR